MSSPTQGIPDIESLVENYRSQVVPIESDDVITFKRSQLLSWYRLNRRLLPWGGDNTTIVPSPYGTWISEIMLQQTRVETVIEYWKRWMERFPNLESLSIASPDDVNQMWAGLGYYRRAQQLLKGAQYVVKEYNGVIPSSIVELLKIPGIGPYTAGAIASIAFNKAEPLVDGNVIRVFSRLYGLTAEIGGSGGKIDKTCWSLAKTLVDPQDPASFNQSLMELGATVCKPTSPSCSTCPLRGVCVAKSLVDHKLSSSDSTSLADIPSEVTYFPRKVAKKKPIEVVLSVCVLVAQASPDLPAKYLFTRRPSTGLLANQWEFPCVKITERESTRTNEDDENEEELDEEANDKTTTTAASISERPSEVQTWSLLREHFQTKLGLLFDSTASIEANQVQLCEVLSSINYSDLLKEPIVHIFSHQRHTMFITVKHVHADVLNNSCFKSEVDNTTSDSKEVIDLEAPEPSDVNKGRWMSAEEIIAEGITTGCKKILNEVIKCSNGSISGKTEGNGTKRVKKIKVEEVVVETIPLELAPKKVFANAFERMLDASSSSSSSSSKVKAPVKKKIKVEAVV